MTATPTSTESGLGTGASCAGSAARALLERLAVETESLIDDAHKLEMRYGETSITDRNLLEIRRANFTNIRVFHVPQPKERDFGYDWEWWLRVGGGPWTVFFLQAKKLNPKTGRYDSLSHRVRGTDKLQIDLLWDHAHQFGGIPLYSFYNGPRASINTWNCDLGRDDHQFGCSVVPLHLVRTFISSGRRQRSQHTGKHSDFERLHENDRAIPWRCMVCASRVDGDRRALASLLNPGIEVRNYEELPFYLQQVINTEREYVLIREYPQSAPMFPRHIAVISIEPPTTVVPPQLPAPEIDNLPTLSEMLAEAKRRNRAKVLV
jgi:hypothetical protein